MTSSSSNVIPLFPSEQTNKFTLFVPENEKYPHGFQFFLACEAVTGSKENAAISLWSQIPEEVKNLLEKQVQLFLLCYGIRI